MRTRFAGALIGAATAALAHGAQAQTTPGAGRPHLDARYPAAAAAAGVEGRVDLCCRPAPNDRLSCVVGRETPAGWGFGAQALALSTLMPATPDVARTVARTGLPVLIPLKFQLTPPPGATPVAPGSSTPGASHALDPPAGVVCAGSGAR